MLQSSACLFFPFGVVFVVYLFNFIIKNPKSLHLSPRPHLSPDRNYLQKSFIYNQVQIEMNLLVDDSSRLLEVDEESVEKWYKHLSHIRHHHHLRLGQSALHIIEVQDLIIGDKTHSDSRSLCSLLSSKHTVHKKTDQ